MSVLARTNGWLPRLNAFFHEHADTPFAWGSHDCVTFAASAIEVQTGRRIWAPDWKNEDEAVRLAVSLRGLEAAASAVLGPPISNWRLARIGDVCLVRSEGKPALAVCTGQTLAGPGPKGLNHLPLDAAEKVWRVG
ncbi:MAG TPA: hypothetical protein VFB13_17880 [Reyranella sp.]|nr:hypothetical protein [Reyranella sp.]